ncbi:MAG: hypothetical protein F4105_11780 [Gemmatimonadetes bacterium]|nr:hypothetical protein [Gemmatimonadota bacterium]
MAARLTSHTLIAILPPLATQPNLLAQLAIGGKPVYQYGLLAPDVAFGIVESTTNARLKV